MGLRGRRGLGEDILEEVGTRVKVVEVEGALRFFLGFIDAWGFVGGSL